MILAEAACPLPSLVMPPIAPETRAATAGRVVLASASEPCRGNRRDPPSLSKTECLHSTERVLVIAVIRHGSVCRPPVPLWRPLLPTLGQSPAVGLRP